MHSLVEPNIMGVKSNNQELYEKLREMRLPIMAEEYKDQSENPSIQNMTFEERLEAMVIKEYDSRILLNDISKTPTSVIQTQIYRISIISLTVKSTEA